MLRLRAKGQETAGLEVGRCAAPVAGGWGRFAAFLLWLAAGLALASPADKAGRELAQPAPGADLFTNAVVHSIRIEITAKNIEELRRDSRKYVPATVRAGPTVCTDVGVHLKGSTGSFRSLDDKPALTLNFAKFTPEQRFHGLRKIHLNNSVEDPSYLNEQIGSALFRAAGVPAPRVAWATVELNGRKLGLYVLKEGFTEDFLALHFREAGGNLYEGSGGDVNTPRPRDAGSGPENPAELQRLADAALEAEPVKRWSRLEQVLDVERFISFMATEVMIGHRDGYCLARNNYRIYHDPARDKMVFLPHGLDQLFGKADAPWQPHCAGLVATAVMETPAGRRQYRERLGFLLTNVFVVPALSVRVDEWATQILPALRGREARAFRQEVAAVKKRLASRQSYLAGQMAQPEPGPLQFENGVARLANWTVVDEPAGGKMDRAAAPDGRPALHIRAGPLTMGSWRCKLRLAQGRYRLEGTVRTAGVRPLGFGKNKGAGLRVAEVALLHPYNLTGDSGWRPSQVEFAVAAAEQEIELICELRASRGEAWFQGDSLRLVRLR